MNLNFEIDRSTSNVYVRSLPIEEVYVTRYGYRVLYRSGNGRLHYANMPLDWFGSAAGRGTVIYSDNKAVPFMNVVFIDGEQSHVNLFLPRNRQSLVYRPIDRTEDWQARFAGIDSLELRY
ncbi:hypothetical protein [Spirochaeta africana]|uniref:hypothetical protein n=1 Tax=Spirochaeta africana TaxID=46355 RepID=UPI0002F20D1B|nr:hypothetical protein [Spirochaeta africana]